MTSYSKLKSPVGDLLLVANESKLTGIYFGDRSHVPKARATWKLDPDHPVLRETAKQLGEFFNGKRTDFSIPFEFSGTDFQQKVWKQIARIPYGKTITYSELASRAGRPDAVRAAGTNTGRNPLAIVVPCHRVMGKNGTLTGFAGGLDRKQLLLEIEGFKPKAQDAPGKRVK
jgi:methylated-DNA-[protein]-cysteine S-methyltransferase